MQHIILAGYGYVSAQIAPILASHGLQVDIITRQTVASYPYGKVHTFGDDLPAADGILFTAPPQDGDDPYLHQYGAAAFKNYPWLGYLSSTGVYGDTHGSPVSEDSPLLATSERGKNRIQAETAWISARLNLHIFRLGGIYGPGRNMLKRVREGQTSNLEQSDRPVNRIHVADIAQTVWHSLNKPNPMSIYNVVDDLPAPTRHVIDYAKKLLRKPVAQTGDKHTKSHLHDGSRVVLNDKIKKELGVNLIYPDFKHGLESLV